MPRFCKSSKSRLKGLDPRLVVVLERVCKHFDITVIEGLRSQKRQNELVKQGKSKTKFGKHVQGKAVDIAPYPIDWTRDRFYFLAGLVFAKADELGIKIRWGGDWDNDKDFKDQSFDDLPHFELL